MEHKATLIARAGSISHEFNRHPPNRGSVTTDNKGYRQFHLYISIENLSGMTCSACLNWNNRWVFTVNHVIGLKTLGSLIFMW